MSARLEASDCSSRDSTLFSICLRSLIRSRFSCFSAVLSFRSALSSDVMALTLAVKVLIVSAGVSASGLGACGTASNSCGCAASGEQDLMATIAVRSSTEPARRGNKRLLVTIDMLPVPPHQRATSKGRSEIRYTAEVSASPPEGSRRLC